jgi:hypothetical protein
MVLGAYYLDKGVKLPLESGVGSERSGRRYELPMPEHLRRGVARHC